MDGTQASPVAESDKLRIAIVEQLQKLEDDTDLTSASDFRMAQDWESINTYLGMSIVLVSGIVTVIGAASALEETKELQPYLVVASTVLASIATVIGSVLTFLKPSERGGRYREFGNKHKTLRNRIRIYRTVQILRESSLDAPADQLTAFGAEKDALNSDNPPIPRTAFKQASKEVKEKQARRAGLYATSPPSI